MQSDDSTAQGHSSESNSDDGKLNGLSEESELSWWFNKDDRTFRGTNVNGPAIGFEESVRLVEETWKTKGPFHGLLGFSQGASFAALLCSLSARGSKFQSKYEKNHFILVLVYPFAVSSVKPRFVILASGFRSGSLAHKNYYEDTLLIPSLHIMGTSDEIIPIDMSQSLASIFEEPELVEHPGGHYFPSSPAQKPIYINFISDGLQDYLEERELETAKELKMEIKNGSSDESD